MTKKVITLTLSDLKDLGIIPKDKASRTSGSLASSKQHKSDSCKRRSKNRLHTSGKRRLRANIQEAIIGGPKSDSSHMRGYSTTIPNYFNNSNNLTTEIQQANLEAIRNKPTTGALGQSPLLIEEAIRKGFETQITPYIQRTTDEFGRINNTIDRGIQSFNQLQNQVNQRYPEGNQRPPLYSLSGTFGSLEDNAGAFATTPGSDYFKDAGNLPADAPTVKVSLSGMTSEPDLEETFYEEIPPEPKSYIDLQIEANELLGKKSKNMAASTYKNYQKELKTEDSKTLIKVIDKLKRYKAGRKIKNNNI